MYSALIKMENLIIITQYHSDKFFYEFKIVFSLKFLRKKTSFIEIFPKRKEIYPLKFKPEVYKKAKRLLLIIRADVSRNERQ